VFAENIMQLTPFLKFFDWRWPIHEKQNVQDPA
jgi:hypothetical protein